MVRKSLTYVLAGLVCLALPILSGGGQSQPAAPPEDLTRPRPYRLEMNKGKGYVLCETLLETARRLHPNGLYRPLEPVLTWKQVFGIPAIAEPPWTDLDPLQHEALFAKLHGLYEITRSPSYSGKLNEVDVFFALNRYPCLGTRPIHCNIPREERLKTSLEGYREFAKNGGRMRMYPLDINSKQAPFPAALIQYEYAHPPEWSNRGEWLGFSFYASPDLSDRIVNNAINKVEVGPHRRLVLYQSSPVILNIDATPYLLGRYTTWPDRRCTIIRVEVKTQR